MAIIPKDDIEKFKEMSLKDINELFKLSCKNNAEVYIKFFLTSPELKQNADIHYDGDCALAYASKHNNIELMKYFLTSPQLKEHAKIDENINIIMYTCENGDINTIQYLLNSPDLKVHCDINKNTRFNLLVHAWTQENLDVIKFLLTSPTLKEHFNIHNDNDSAFKYFAENSEEVLNYLIYDYEIKITDDIREYIKEHPELKAIMEAKELKDKLDKKSLPDNQRSNKFKV